MLVGQSASGVDVGVHGFVDELLSFEQHLAIVFLLQIGPAIYFIFIGFGCFCFWSFCYFF
jgi:hypothetical protein